MAALPNTIEEAGALLRAGELSSGDLVEASIASADRLDRWLGVYLARFDERARADARNADCELADGHDRGLLHGIPIGVKDMIDMSGIPTTAQSRVPNPEWYAGRDATVIRRLRAAGAVLTGKTTLMEFGCGIPDAAVTEPLARNPHNPDRWAGGSSSGSASGVAAGMFLAALGGDTAGSIRMPAAFCGVTGLMPTFGRVPKSGCIPLGYSFGRTGPLARSAGDCAAVLAALTGSGRPPTRPDAGMNGLRVGVVTAGHFPAGVDPALRGCFDAAIEAFTALGARPREVELPFAEELVTATFVTATSEGLAQHRRHVGAHWSDYTVAGLSDGWGGRAALRRLGRRGWSPGRRRRVRADLHPVLELAGQSGAGGPHGRDLRRAAVVAADRRAHRRRRGCARCRRGLPARHRLASADPFGRGAGAGMSTARGEETLRELLTASGLPASDAEVAALARVYRELTAPLTALHAVRAGEPVLGPIIEGMPAS